MLRSKRDQTFRVAPEGEESCQELLEVRVCPPIPSETGCVCGFAEERRKPYRRRCVATSCSTTS